MDGLLKPEFALVLKDSLNPTPRRHILNPSQQSIPTPTKKQSSSEFRLQCDMQLEPRLHFTPFPTSPTSPLPTKAFLDSPAPRKPLSTPTDRNILSPANVGILTHDLSPSQRSTPINKQKKSSLLAKRLSSQLSSTLDSTSSSLPLDVLASVSIEQREKPSFEPLTPINKNSTPHQSILSSTSSLPASPIILGPSAARIQDDKPQTHTRTTKLNKNSAKSNSTGKTFPCSQCPSSFSQQFNLNKHVRAVHERRRPFQCDICHARFQQKSHRNMHHLAVHEKLRQFACDQCNASFSWRGVLKKHRKSIHGIDD